MEYFPKGKRSGATHKIAEVTPQSTIRIQERLLAERLWRQFECVGIELRDILRNSVKFHK